jgi:alpha-D-ribose 1-methylphosphonate 5-triphosphate diphosphatase
LSWQILGGRVLSDRGIRIDDVRIVDGKITSRSDIDAQIFNASGNLVLPGIVDVHGDAFERQIQPRPGVEFDLDLALFETDRQLISNGITTAFHGLTISWEPGLRSLENGRKFFETLRQIRRRLLCDNRLHIRWETYALEALNELLEWLKCEEQAIFAFNDHTTSMAIGGKQRENLTQWASRSGLSPEDYLERLNSVFSRREEVEKSIIRAASAALEQGAVLFAHDEASPADRIKFRGLGAVASEFPTTSDTARVAREAGEHTILGAPNVVRGGSHTGAVLASDYYYPSQLLAVFKLVSEGNIDFVDAWNLISKNAAEAAGLNDRGELLPGKRADIIIVNDDYPASPQVVAVFVEGRLVLDRGNHHAQRPGSDTASSF